MRPRMLILGFILLGLALSVPATAADGDPSADEQVLQAAGLATDGPSLQEFFRKRSQTAADRGAIATLVRQLGDPSFAVREQASADLIAWGSLAVPALRQAAHDADNRVTAPRARECLATIGGAGTNSIPVAAARLLARSRAEGTAEVLLSYLPYADGDAVAVEVEAALASVAFANGRPNPALLRALADESPSRRIAAAETLVWMGRAEQWAVVSRLLRDPKPAVRLAVGLALAAVRWDEAFPVLIALLEELPPEQTRPAEDALRLLAGDWAPKVVLGSDPASRAKCRQAWTDWWQGQDVATMLDTLRGQTLSDSERERLWQVIGKLSDDSFTVREQTTAELTRIGAPLVPLLRQALRHADPEIAFRAQRCLQAIKHDVPGDLPTVAARMAALRKPAGAAEVLLAYLPFAEDEHVSSEVKAALPYLACRDGHADPVLVRALQDHLPVRRLAAAEALCQAGLVTDSAMRVLLRDPDVRVRLRIALALGTAGEREAVPALIALLTEVPAEEAWQVEEFLQFQAGSGGPKIRISRDGQSRQASRDAWADWWRDQGARVSLIKPDQRRRLLGYTLLVQMDPDNEVGSVLELDAAGKVRWQINQLEYPIDAQVLPGNRVLIVEQEGACVTERDFTGKVLWRKDLPTSPLTARRLGNGNTFIATRNQLVEVNPAGKEVFAYGRTSRDIRSAGKLDNGQYLIVTSPGNCIVLDAEGKELRSYSVGGTGIPMNGCDVLPSGRVLVPVNSQNKVREYDSDGKIIWEVTATQPSSVTRLANGNVLVSSANNHRVYEINGVGRVVWEHRVTMLPMRARRR